MPNTLSISDADKARLRVLFLAKHALSGGVPDAVDGTHAVYHHEMLTTLREIGLNVSAANRYDDLFERPDTDFVVTLLNRGGFVNSEMLAPLLLRRLGLPFLGAARPVRRQASDEVGRRAARRAADTLAGRPPGAGRGTTPRLRLGATGG